MVIAMSEAAPTILSSIQRERETEMVWRGKQYVRGVRMYYMKMQHFPTSLDDLTKPKTGIRFMRQAYKDPMNQVDGSWRLIYVGPNGQLIGSYNNQTINIGMGGAPGAGAVAMGSSGTSTLGNSSFGNNSSFGSNSSFGNSSTFGSTGFGNTQTGTTAQTGTAGTATNGANSGAPDSSTDPDQPHSIAGPMDASNTIGGNIIGVGSKVNKASFLVYKKAKNYKKFEFIWDPSADITVGGASMGIGTPIGGANSNGMSPAGSSPFSSPFSSGVNGAPNSQNPQQNNQNSIGNPSTNGPPLQAPPNQ